MERRRDLRPLLRHASLVAVREVARQLVSVEIKSCKRPFEQVGFGEANRENDFPAAIVVVVGSQRVFGLPSCVREPGLR